MLTCLKVQHTVDYVNCFDYGDARRYFSQLKLFQVYCFLAKGHLNILISKSFFSLMPVFSANNDNKGTMPRKEILQYLFLESKDFSACIHPLCFWLLD